MASRIYEGMSDEKLIARDMHIKGGITVRKGGPIPKRLIRFVEEEEGTKFAVTPKYYIYKAKKLTKESYKKGYGLSYVSYGKGPKKPPTGTLIALSDRSHSKPRTREITIVHELAELMQDQKKYGKNPREKSHTHALRIERKFQKKTVVRKRKKQTNRRKPRKDNYLSNLRL